MNHWQRSKSRLQRVMMTGIGVYAAAMLFYVVARLLFGEQWGLVELGNSLMPSLVLPVIVLIPVMLLRKRWRPAVAMFPALIFLVVNYAALFTPRAISVPDTAVHIRVLTFNLGSYVPDYLRLIKVMESAQANVILVQEMLTPSADEITAALGDHYPYHALHPVDYFAGGVGIFSQFPIIDDKYLDGFVLGGQRTRLAFTDTQAITLINAHPNSPKFWGSVDSSLREKEISELLDIAAGETNPLLMAGDFNITDMTDDYARIRARYGDAFRAAGSGFGPSFPDLGHIFGPLRVIPPLIRIDYVFYSAEWTAIDAYPLPDAGSSDHYPFFAELGLNPGNERIH